MPSSTNDDSLAASMIAACVLTLAIGVSTLVAQRPAGVTEDQASGESTINNAQSDPEEAHAPVYGLTLEKREGELPYIAKVEPDSAPWRAGLRNGDAIVSFGSVRDVPYDDFLTGITKVAGETYDKDKITVVYRRDGEELTAELAGVGRSPKSLRKLKERSEKAVEEQLEPEMPAAGEAGAQQAISTEQIEDYLDLQRRSQEGSLSAADQRRYDELGTVFLGGGLLGGSGGLLGGGYGAGATGPAASTGPRWRQTREGDASSTATAGATLDNGQQIPETGVGDPNAGSDNGVRQTGVAGTTSPGTDIGDPNGQATNPNARQPNRNGMPANPRADGAFGESPLPGRLGAEFRQLQQMRQRGMNLQPAQARRLNALEQLSALNGSTTGAAARGSSFNQTMQAEFRQLQQASRSGRLSPQQQSRFNQLRQMQQAAVSRPGANRNLPNGGNAQAARGVNRNLPQGAAAGAGLNRNLPAGAAQGAGAGTGVGGAVGGAAGAAGAGASPAAGGSAGASSAAGAGTSIGEGGN